jgi:uncharacterized SAM-binding protein YcdF (DUF218 family)
VPIGQLRRSTSIYAAYRLSQLLLQVEVWIFLCLLSAGVLAFRRRFVPSRRLLLLGFALFYGASITPTAKALIGPLESRYPPFLTGRQPTYDAIVVLAGAIRRQPPEDSYTILGTESLDRLICGINLLKEASASLLVLSGGVSDLFGPTPAVASVIKDQALRLGTPPNAIMIETHSRTTAESAVEVRRLLPDAQRIVIASSAYHLPRAVALFKKQGFAEVIPAPCYYEITGKDFVATDFIPGYQRLRLVDSAIHEYVGIAVYRALGKL